VLGVNDTYDYLWAKRQFGIEKYSILVTGASGFLGKKLYSTLGRGYQVTGLQYSAAGSGFPSVDLTDPVELRAFIDLNKPDVIIHAAGTADPTIARKTVTRLTISTSVL
jgi:dTDP-4-dehydrorhamnose reductase